MCPCPMFILRLSLYPPVTLLSWQGAVLVAATLIVVPPRWLPDRPAGQLDLNVSCVAMHARWANGKIPQAW